MLQSRVLVILVNVKWLDKEAIGLEPKVAGKLMYELERKGIKSEFVAKVVDI